MVLAAGAVFGGTGTATAKGLRDPGATPAYLRTLADYSSQDVDWQPCYDDGTSPELQCAWIAAPTDWHHPGVGDIEVLITRIKATGKRYGILQTNPGGPGLAGYWLPLYLEEAEPEVAEHYDVIGMDPRGTLGSTALQCGGTGVLDRLYALDGLDRSSANTERFIALSRAEAAGCATDPLTPYVDTDQTARDLDLVRALLGESRTNWLGYSAGTRLGAWYATLFPSRVGRFVLDGNWDFTRPVFESFQRQPEAFQTSFEDFLIPWLARYDAVYHLGRTPAAVERTYHARRAALAAHPITLVDGTELTGNGYDSAIAGLLYYTGYYPEAGAAMSTLERYSTADADARQQVADWFGNPGADQSDHTFWATICQETEISAQQVWDDWMSVGRKYPLVGSTWLANPCPYWHFPATGSPVTGSGIPRLLMLQNDHDPATPFQGGLAAHRRTPGSVFVTIRNEPDHTIYGSGDVCADDIVNRWLLRGALPSSDRSCPGVPLPDPTAESAARVATASTAPVQVWGEKFMAEHPTPAP
jgi:pimeloyl-ACP methyl ester carboxylesterase